MNDVYFCLCLQECGYTCVHVHVKAQGYCQESSTVPAFSLHFFFEVRSLNQAQSSVMSLVFLLARLLNGFPDIAWVCSFRWAVLLSLHLGGFWGISSGPLIIPALRSFSLTSVTLPNLLFHEQSTLHYLASPRFHPSLLPLVVHSNTGCKDTYLKCIRQKCRSHLHNDHLA